MPHRRIVLPPPILLPFPYHLSRRRPFLRCPWNPPSFVNHHHHFHPPSHFFRPERRRRRPFILTPTSISSLSSSIVAATIAVPSSPSCSVFSVPPVDCCIAEPIRRCRPRRPTSSSPIDLPLLRHHIYDRALRHRSPVRSLFPAKHENKQLLLAAIVMRGGEVKHKI